MSGLELVDRIRSVIETERIDVLGGNLSSLARFPGFLQQELQRSIVRHCSLGSKAATLRVQGFRDTGEARYGKVNGVSTQ